MPGAILFNVCDSCLITLTFTPRRLPRCRFQHQMLKLEIAKTNYLFLVVIFSHPTKWIASCADLDEKKTRLGVNISLHNKIVSDLNVQTLQIC